MATLNIGCGFDKFGDIKLDKYPKSKEVIKWDANIDRKLPCKDNSISEVRMIGVIMYCKYPHELLEECWRVLQPNGIFEMTSINITSMRFKIKPIGRKDTYKKAHDYGFEKIYSVYNEYNIREHLEDIGFNIDSIEYGTIIPPFKDRLIIKAHK